MLRKMKLIKEIYNENETTKLIDYLEMLRIDGIVYKHYGAVEDFLKYVEYVEYTLNEDISEILKPKYDTIRIETDYFVGNFTLTRVYIKNSKEWDNGNIRNIFTKKLCK